MVTPCYDTVVECFSTASRKKMKTKKQQSILTLMSLKTLAQKPAASPVHSKIPNETKKWLVAGSKPLVKIITLTDLLSKQN